MLTLVIFWNTSAAVPYHNLFSCLFCLGVCGYNHELFVQGHNAIVLELHLAYDTPNKSLRIQINTMEI